MRWIGLSGGIASGKSTVARLFKGRGIPVIDADQIAHDAVKKESTGLKLIVQAFGPEILTSSYELDRKKMGRLVFGNPKKLIELENIIHPLVQQEVQKQRAALNDQGTSFAIYDVPLLFEKKLQRQFDGILVVGCDSETQIQRILARNGFTKDEAIQRIHAQMPLADKKKEATWYLDNSGNFEELERNFSAIFTKIQSATE